MLLILRYKIILLLSIAIFVIIAEPVFADLSSITLATGVEINPVRSRALAQAPATSYGIDDLKNQIEHRQTEIEELREQAKEYRGAIDETREYAETLSGAVSIFNNQIRDVENSIDIKRKEISSTALQIRRIELEIQAKEESIKRTRQYIAALLREIYRDDDTGAVELILKYDDFSEFFNQVEYRNLLQEDLGGRLAEVRALKDKLGLDKGELNLKRDELGILKQGLEDRNSVLLYQKSQKQDLLEETKSTEWRYKNLLLETEERQKEMSREVFELEDALRRALDPNLVPAAFAGVLSWPAEGILTQSYGCIKAWTNAYPSEDCPSGYNFHNGLDIAASFGTPIRAARDGIVVALQDDSVANKYNYGRWIAVEHDNGLVSLYTHLSAKKVSVGQRVSMWEIIAYMGSTGLSTGSHLHFTVFAPKSFQTKRSIHLFGGIIPFGATLNPLDYLP